MVEAAGDVSEDSLLGGAVRLLQPRTGHRAGTDAVLLAAAASTLGARRAVDLGSASGAVGLQLCRRDGAAQVLFVDSNPGLIELCRRNISLNGLGARADAIVADILAPSRDRLAMGLRPGGADLVVTNPPFFEGSVRRSPDPGRRMAHVMREGGLKAWIGTAAWLLAPKGTLCLIHRADHLASCLDALVGGFGAIEVTPVHSTEDEPAARVLVVARKGARGPLRLAPALILHQPGGRFSARAEALHRL